MERQPLVSVPVITFNSSAYIVAGLESIKAQTYQNIELIVSDDCSTDDTVDVVRRWLDEYGSRFVRVELVTSKQNTGVAGNCNRGYSACRGEWIKGLAGDDKFLPYTIERYVKYVTEHTDVDICFAKLNFWGDDEEYVNGNRKSYERNLYPKIMSEDVKYQYREILKTMYIPGPGLFFKTSLWKSVGGFDEKYPFCEEWPFTLRVLKHGYRIYFLDEELYGYHVRRESICHSRSKVYTMMINNIYSYFKDERRELLKENGLSLFAFDQNLSYKSQLAALSGKSTKSFACKYIRLFLPIVYMNKIEALKRRW